MKKNILLFVFALLSTLTASAYDAEIDGIYYNLDTSTKTATVTYKELNYSSYTGSVEIPETVTYDDITYSVASIDFAAFSGCSDLKSVTIPNSVISIGVGAFSVCSGLTSIIVDTENTKYDSRNNCNAIIETATNTLISGCKKTTIPNSVTSIGDYAFCYCSGLTSVTIPNSVTAIGEETFSGCTGLTSIEIPNSVTEIGDNAFSDCSNLESVILSDNLTAIGAYSFCKCSNLKSVTIPDKVTYIESGVFDGCSRLSYITIPNSVTSIGEWAFTDCSGLTSITIGKSVTSIEYSAFNCGDLLKDVYCYAENVPSTSDYAFNNKAIANVTLHVPTESINAYQTTEPWSGFGNIVAIGSEPTLRGDVNEDGTVNGTDIQEVINTIVNAD